MRIHQTITNTAFIVSLMVSVFVFESLVLTTTEETLSAFEEVVDPRRYDTTRHGNAFHPRESHHIAFLKVHKTASSTTANILLRFGESRNLTFMLSQAGEKASVISLNDTIRERYIVPPPTGKQYEILCLHVFYNSSVFKNSFPNDTVIIGSVREPYSRFKSALRFYKDTKAKHILSIQSKNPVSEYLNNPFKYESKDPTRSMVNNRMALEFGFPSGLFPGHLHERSIEETDSYLQKLNKEFSLIMVAEYYDESLVLLRRLLNWSLSDILYTPFHVSRKSWADEVIEQLLPDDEENFRSFSYLDYSLYNFSVKRLRRQLEHNGSDLRNEVIYFKEMRNKVSKFCENKNTSSNVILEIEESPWNKRFCIGEDDCLRYTMSATQFVKIIRRKQFSEN